MQLLIPVRDTCFWRINPSLATITWTYMNLTKLAHQVHHWNIEQFSGAWRIVKCTEGYKIQTGVQHTTKLTKMSYLNGQIFLWFVCDSAQAGTAVIHCSNTLNNCSTSITNQPTNQPKSTPNNSTIRRCLHCNVSDAITGKYSLLL